MRHGASKLALRDLERLGPVSELTSHPPANDRGRKKMNQFVDCGFSVQDLREWKRPSPVLKARWKQRS